MGCHSLLQGIFPTRGSNPGLLHCRQTLYHLNRSLISGSMMPPVLLSFFKVALAIQGLLWFHTNFQIVQSIPVKYAIEILIVSDLNL